MMDIFKNQMGRFRSQTGLPSFSNWVEMVQTPDSWSSYFGANRFPKDGNTLFPQRISPDPASLIYFGLSFEKTTLSGHLPVIYLSFTGHLPAIYRFSFFQDFIAGTVSPKATTRFPPKCQVFPTLHQPRQDLGNLDPFMPNFLILTTGLARGTPRNRIMG